jgi:hypothetical protein
VWPSALLLSSLLGKLMGLRSIILQFANGVFLMVTGEKRVAQGHFDVLVSH